MAISDVASALGIEIQRRADLPAPARWHRVQGLQVSQPTLWEEDCGPVEHDLIVLRSDLPEAARRFALAHEIGHAVLQRDRDSRPQLAHHLKIDRRLEERYANAFASELLLPASRAADVRRQFRATTRPVDLLRIASSLGISPQTLLFRADEERWMAGLQSAWLDIRIAPNRATGLDRRPRIHQVALDKRHWLLPANRSVAGALGEDEWLLGVSKDRHLQGTLDISRRVYGSRARWVHEHVPVHVLARRLRNCPSVPGIDFLAYVSLQADGAS